MNELEPQAPAIGDATDPPTDRDVADPPSGDGHVSREDFEELREQMGTLQGELVELQRGAYKDRIIEQLQGRIAELEKYESTVRRFRSSVILLFDLVDKIEREYRESIEEGASLDASQWLGDLEVLRVDIENQLFSAGLDMYRSTDEDLAEAPKLDVQRQRAVRTEPTEDPGRDLVVLRSVRAGFTDQDGRAVRKEEVVVHKHRPAPKEPA